MDVDEHVPRAAASNAVAGPSNLSDMLAHYLPPPGPPRSATHFASTQDLLARFRLLPAYDKYVRPFNVMTTTTALGATAVSAPTPNDKGKGKEKEISTPAAASTPGGPADGEDEDEKKKKKNYKYLIQGIPGKHSMKKDDYLTAMIQIPPKQRNAITPFDLKTQREAFSVSLSGLQGWNINSLVEESPQAREDRKKRKEQKRLAKAQAAAAAAANSSPVQPQPVPATVSAAQSRGITPRPGVPHPPARTTTPVTTNMPRPVPVAASAPPRPKPTPKVATAPTPAPSTPGQDPFIIKRGKKRDREDAVVVPANSQGPGGGMGANVNGQTKVVSGKAGVPGARPRPVKKQRVDGQGQAREMPVQQPTPQGV